MPTIPEMLKQKLKTEKLATVKDGARVNAGDVKFNDIREIAKSRGGDASAVKMVLGTCVSCGVTVDGKDPREIIKEINEGNIKF